MQRNKYFLSNRKLRIYLDAVAEISGAYGLEAVLQVAGLQRWIREHPPRNDAREIDYVDFSTLNMTLMRMYGQGGGRSLATRAGRISFLANVEHFATVLRIDDPAFQNQPLPARVAALLQAIVDAETQQSAEHATLRVAGDQFLYTVEPCPVCWGQSGLEETMCFSTVGFLQQAIEWVGAGDRYLVEEASCAATKSTADAACVFAILRVE